MEILKEGIMPDNKYDTIEGKCWNCGCHVQCFHSEVKIENRTSPHSYTVSWKYVTCPTVNCGKDIILR